MRLLHMRRGGRRPPLLRVFSRIKMFTKISRLTYNSIRFHVLPYIEMF